MTRPRPGWALGLVIVEPLLTLAALLGLSIGWASEVVMTRVNAERIAQETQQ